MRKLDFCICENKDACQLCSNCTADQYLHFRFSDRTIPLLLQNLKLLNFFCDYTGWFVSDLVRNFKDWFSCDMAQIRDPDEMDFEAVQIIFEPPYGKTNKIVSEQAPHKPVCAATEDC